MSSDHVGDTWSLQEAKARFSEVVRRARAVGPQVVTVRGKEAVVILPAERAPEALAEHETPLVEFLGTSGLGLVPLEREEDLGRDPTL